MLVFNQLIKREKILEWLWKWFFFFFFVLPATNDFTFYRNSFDLSFYKFNYKFFSFSFQNFVTLVLMNLTIDNFERRFFERERETVLMWNFENGIGKKLIENKLKSNSGFFQFSFSLRFLFPSRFKFYFGTSFRIVLVFWIGT